MANANSVSVIIPAYGPTPYLSDVLSAITSGSRKPDEIIVSHSGSDDPTELLRKRHPSVRILHLDERLFAGEARNRGASVAESEILVFCDSDVLPRPDWLERLVSTLSAKLGSFVVGSVGVARSGGYWGMSNWLCEFSEQVPWRPSGFQTGGASCNMAVRKMDFDAVEGFAGERRGQDTMLFFRLRNYGLKQWFASEAQVGHFNNAGLIALAKHQFVMGLHFPAMRAAVPMRGSSIIARPILAYGLWIPKIMLVVGRVLDAGCSGWMRAIYYSPGILLGSWIWTVGCVRGLRAVKRSNSMSHA
jgi:glycosyltransferase involved in cell wall biosynthesis